MPLQRYRFPRLKKGWLVEIIFLDHVCTTGGMVPPIVCRAIGEVINEDKDAFYLASWLTEESDHANIDSHTVLKSTIKSVKLIRKKRK
jgi:hypothetical protein